MAFAPYVSRSPFEVWIVPRRHEADFGRVGPADIAATAEALRQVLSRLADSLDGPPYNLVLHTAPLREQVDSTYHWHWEIHPRLREIAGLESEPACRSTPSHRRTRSRSCSAGSTLREVRRVERRRARAPARVTPGGGPPSLALRARPDIVARRVPSSARSLRGHRPSLRRPQRHAHRTTAVGHAWDAP